ncbi:MAG: glycosyltransferase family 2 protein [Myxococcales bacterium]|nr:glycosyltransferase family 2 protein [Myxococcales bacterium]
MRIDAVIPALDEEATIAAVVRAVKKPPVHTVWVVDNASADRTAEEARIAGAQVLQEPRRGYGNACLAALRRLPAEVDAVVFLDGDGSDDPSLIPGLVAPIVRGEADLVVGSRSLGGVQQGALSLQQRLGNAVAARWLSTRYGLPATDLGPFRAVRRSSLDSLLMSDPDYGWTVEMQIKAARAGLRYREVPVPCGRRAGGQSKVSGTVAGVLGASAKILGLLFRHDVLRGWAR